jgi:hypothetical protein
MPLFSNQCFDLNHKKIYLKSCSKLFVFGQLFHFLTIYTYTNDFLLFRNHFLKAIIDMFEKHGS